MKICICRGQDNLARLSFCILAHFAGYALWHNTRRFWLWEVKPNLRQTIILARLLVFLLFFRWLNSFSLRWSAIFISHSFHIYQSQATAKYRCRKSRRAKALLIEFLRAQTYGAAKQTLTFLRSFCNTEKRMKRTREATHARTSNHILAYTIETYSFTHMNTWVCVYTWIFSSLSQLGSASMTSHIYLAFIKSPSKPGHCEIQMSKITSVEGTPYRLFKGTNIRNSKANTDHPSHLLLHGKGNKTDTRSYKCTYEWAHTRPHHKHI